MACCKVNIKYDSGNSAERFFVIINDLLVNKLTTLCELQGS